MARVMTRDPPSPIVLGSAPEKGPRLTVDEVAVHVLPARQEVVAPASAPHIRFVGIRDLDTVSSRNAHQPRALLRISEEPGMPRPVPRPRTTHRTGLVTGGLGPVVLGGSGAVVILPGGPPGMSSL